MQFTDEGFEGYDVSKWQRFVQHDPPIVKEINFQKMKESGADFVIMKAGQYDFTDFGWPYNWPAAKEAGLARGSYWFMDYRDTPKVQAQRHWNLIKHDLGEGIHAADFELGSDNKIDSVYVFLNELQQLSGLPNDRFAVYSTYYYWIGAQGTTAQRSWFRKFPLWLAWYALNPAIVQVPYPWSEVPEQPILWQDGTPARGLEVGAWSREIDHNRLNGGRDKLLRYFGAEPNNGEGEEPMTNYYEVRSTNSAEYRTIRSGPRVTFPGVTTLPVGNSIALARVDDVYNFTQNSYDGTILRALVGDQWVHVYQVNGVVKDGWIAVRHLGQNYTLLSLIIVEPTPSDEYVLHVKDGVTRKFILED